MIDKIKDKAIITIIDLNDFVTLNAFLQNKKYFHLGNYFHDEIKAISKFQNALSISEEEKVILSPFCSNTRFIHLPVFFESNFLEFNEIKYDLLFIGSNNYFNIQGLNWFIDNVFPLLDKLITLLVVGPVCNHVSDNKNIIKLPYIKNIKEAYEKTKLTVCTLLGGTGLKVKVIESLSFGRPVITTQFGLTGILQKNNNGCILANDYNEFAQKIDYYLKNNIEYNKLVKIGIDFFKKNFSKEIIYNRLDDIF